MTHNQAGSITQFEAQGYCLLCILPGYVLLGSAKCCSGSKDLTFPHNLRYAAPFMNFEMRNQA